MLTANSPLQVVKIILLTVLISSSLFYSLFALIPGSFAWFTSETYATGTIVNATTDDLLVIEPTSLEYGANCTVKSSLAITNISNLDTNVRVFLLTKDGETLIKEQELTSGETMNTETVEVDGLVEKSCSLEQVTYRVDAFINFVSEVLVVPVDSGLLLQPEEKKDDTEKEPKTEVEPVTEPETETENKTESEPETEPENKTETEPETESGNMAETEPTPVAQNPATPITDSTEAATTVQP